MRSVRRVPVPALVTGKDLIDISALLSHGPVGGEGIMPV